jgi:serine/threonine protein kinase
MRPDQWDRVQELLDRAVEVPGPKLESFLEEACPDDPDVRREVASLLGFGSPGFLEPAELSRLAREATAHPERIDAYRIVRCVGEGGMGVVYEAEQEAPVRRTVALKLIRPGMDTDQIVTRFETERQALALMTHPHIARVYDAGVAADGRPYFVMEFADGTPITQFCDERGLTLADRLELFDQVCGAIHHAHQRGIIHRDIKPSNVLIVSQDEDAAPKIIDFGIARAIDRRGTHRTQVTRLGQVVGTAVYMSPEQAGLTAHGVDTRTDVYSLGVLLYQLLVGEPPFDPDPSTSKIDEFYRRLREDDPVRPSIRCRQLGRDAATVRALRGDLDWIVMRALEKDPERRYASALELAADVRRYLGHEPVAARPPSALYQMRKFARRHRLAVVSTVAIVLLLITGTVGTVIGLVQARRAEGRAVAEAETSETITDYFTQIFELADPDADGANVTAREILDASAEKVQKDLADQPGTRGRVQTSMGEAYMGLGLYGKARTMFAEALPLLREAYGEDHPYVYDLLNEMGILALELEDHEAARDSLEQALAIAERTQDADSPDLPPILKNLGVAAVGMGDLPAARAYLELALATRERLYGADHLSVAKTLSSMAGLAVKSGDPGRAVDLARRSLEIRRARLEPGASGLAYGHYFLGEALLADSQHDQGLEHFGAAREIWEVSHGPSHLWVADSLFQEARCHAALSRPDEAYAAYGKSRQVVEQKLSAEDPASAKVLARYLRDYAALLEQIGRAPEAETTRRTAESLL